MSSNFLIFLRLSSAILFWLACFKNSKFRSFSAFVATRSASTCSTLTQLANFFYYLDFSSDNFSLKQFLCIFLLCSLLCQFRLVVGMSFLYTLNHLVWNISGLCSEYLVQSSILLRATEDFDFRFSTSNCLLMLKPLSIVD